MNKLNNKINIKIIKRFYPGGNKFDITIKTVNHLKKLSGLYQISPLERLNIKNQTSSGIQLQKATALYLYKHIYDLYGGNQLLDEKTVWDKIPKVTQEFISKKQFYKYPENHHHGLKPNFTMGQHFLNSSIGYFDFDVELIKQSCNNKINYSSFKKVNALQRLEQEVFLQNYRKSLLENEKMHEVVAINADNLTPEQILSSQLCYNIMKQPHSDFKAFLALDLNEKKEVFLDVKLVGEPERHLSCTRGYISLSPLLDTQQFMLRFKGDLGACITSNATSFAKNAKEIMSIQTWRNTIDTLINNKKLEKNTRFDLFNEINLSQLFDPKITSIAPTKISQALPSDFYTFYDINQQQLECIIDKKHILLDPDIIFPVNQIIDIRLYDNIILEFIKDLPVNIREEFLCNFYKVKLILPP